MKAKIMSVVMKKMKKESAEENDSNKRINNQWKRK